MLDAAFAVRAAGDVPLVGDPRWSDPHWRAVRERFDGAEAPAGAAWATFTSGTTGAPRVVLRSAESWTASFAPVGDLLELTARDVVALPVTVVSSMTMFQAAHARHVGAAIEPAPRGRLLDAQLARATVVHATPLLVRDLIARAEAGAASALRVALVGGDRVPADLRARAASLGIRLIAYAGAAELSFVATDAGAGAANAALGPFPGAEVRVDERGVLWVRSPYVAIGYAGGSPGPLRRDADGWATVGDRARVLTGRDGPRVELLGRDDGAILSAGATVVPADVEACFRGAPGVRDVVAVGVPARRVGALVGVLVVPERGAAADAAWARACVASAAPRMPRSHRPRLVVVADEVPATPAGKLDRAAARDLLAGPAAIRVPWSDDEPRGDDGER